MATSTPSNPPTREEIRVAKEVLEFMNVAAATTHDLGRGLTYTAVLNDLGYLYEIAGGK